MPTVSMTVNGKAVTGEVEGRTLLVHFLRDKLGLTGTHVGCDTAQCGACTVHIDGKSARSCVTPVSTVVGKEVTTIEGLPSALSGPLKQAWIAEDVPQCGYCQSGQIMSAASLLADNADPTDDDIDRAMTGNLCRCGTYNRIRRAIHLAAELKSKGGMK